MVVFRRHLPSDNSIVSLHVALNRAWDAIEAIQAGATTATTSANITGGGGVTVSGGGGSTVTYHNSLSGLQGGLPNKYYHLTDVELTGLQALLAGGGGLTYTNANPTPTGLGGIPGGATFSAQTMQQMWDALLYPYQYPAFGSFGITGQTTPLEVGATSNANPSFYWTDTNPTNITPNSIQIDDATAVETLVTGHSTTSPAAVTHAGITKTSHSSETYTITGTNSLSGTFTRNYTIVWDWMVYYGESATSPLVEADIESLRVGGLSGGFAGTYSYVSDASKYKYLCYPAVYGTASGFTDTSTNLNVPFETVYTVSVTNAHGQTTNYNVHRSTNMIGGAINIRVS